MSRFYLTLPSNSSMDCYPHNTVAQFTTKLSSVIELDGEWEVGLTEIFVPSDVHNVLHANCYYTLYLGKGFVRKINVTPGHYSHMYELLADMHRAQRAQVPLESHQKLMIEFLYESSTGKVKMKRQESLNDYLSIEFSPDLARLLGYDFDVRYTPSHSTVSKYAPNMAPSIHSVYVYCDLVEHVAVGDTKAPLLRIVNTTAKRNENIHQIFNTPLYIPLQKKCFDNVEINIMTDTGLPVPFRSGKSVVVLEFRRAAYKYFAM